MAPRPALSLVPALFALVASFVPARAQTAYPEHPIKIVAPFPPGAPVDIMARLAADQLERAWGEPAVVENRSGGGGIVGSGSVARSAPDGYTLLFTSSSPLAAAPALTKSLPFDPIKDFAPIWGISSSGLVVVVNPALPIKTLGELVQYARANPNKLSFASSGHGTTQHLAGELFMARTGVKLVHVPYRGGFVGQADLIAGHVQLMFDSLGNTFQNIKSGRLRALAVLRPKRSDQLPDVPTAAEAGVRGVDMLGWLGLFAPAGTPAAILDKLTTTLVPAMNEPETMARLIELGNDNDVMTGAALGRRLADDKALFAEIVEKAGIEPQ